MAADNEAVGLSRVHMTPGLCLVTRGKIKEQTYDEITGTSMLCAAPCIDDDVTATESTSTGFANYGNDRVQ